ncbi:MAG: outer-membrane lipoprotein carrier protein LolA, partial [Gammaproteobacteria bacterium]
MRVFVFFLAAGFVSPLAAEGSLSTLERFFAEFQSLEARFSQEIFDDKGESLQRSTGDVQLSRPGRFRWQYGQPFEQLIL